MSQSGEREEAQGRDGGPADARKAYQKPGISWEEAVEPITHAYTCAHIGGTGEPCNSSPDQ